MNDQLTAFPAEFTAGDTFDLLETLADYPASAGWVLNYALRGLGLSVINLASVASGDNHLIQVAAASSTNPVVVGTDVWKPGTYSAAKFVSKVATGERYQLGKTTLTVLPNPTALTASDDTRSHARIVLDAIRAVIEGTATTDQEEITLDTGGIRRSLKKRSIDDLLKLESVYRQRVAAEDSAATGQPLGGRLLMRL